MLRMTGNLIPKQKVLIYKLSEKKEKYKMLRDYKFLNICDLLKYIAF